MAEAVAARYLLTMTATVTPARGAQVRRASPEVRLEDYKRALRFWLSYEHAAAERILLLENSGADLGPLRVIAERENPRNKEVEFVSLPAKPIPAGSNYGYAEMEMLDDGLMVSRLRRSTTHLVKTTGRLVFPALGRALDRVARPGAPELELMIDCRKLSFPRRGFDAQVQLFVCSHGFYDRVLRDAKSEMNSTDLRLLEHLIFRKVIPFKGRPGHYLRFPCNVDPEGYFGFKDRRYDSAAAIVTGALRAALRVVAPDFWF